MILFINKHVAENWTCLGNLLAEIFREQNSYLVLILLFLL